MYKIYNIVYINLMRALGRKKTHVCFLVMHGLNLDNLRAYLKQRKLEPDGTEVELELGFRVSVLRKAKM